MRVATWNVNGIRARLEFVLHWLRARQPDVVGLQELKVTDEEFPYEAFAAEGYAASVHGQKAWNGVAVLSRSPIEPLQRGLPGQEDAGARLLLVRTAGVRFATVYCPNGKHVNHEDFPRKLAWFDALADYLADAEPAEGEFVLCGDFNVCPSALDTWNEEGLRGSIFHTDEERTRYRRILALGLHDLFRERHPEERAFSWWDYRAGAFHRNLGLRIDLILGNDAVRERLEEVLIDREYRKKKDGLTASDHAPVLATLR